MPLSLSASTLAELAKPKPRLRAQAEIIKNYYATQTVIDISNKIISWGRLENNSTLVAVDWELPNLTITVSNLDDYFHDRNTSGIWSTSPSKAPEECVLRVRLWVITDSGKETLIDYLGRIKDCKLQAGTKFVTADITTVFEPAFTLDQECTIKNGSYMTWDTVTATYYDKGGICYPAPSLIVWHGWTAGPPFPFNRGEFQYASSLCLVENYNSAASTRKKPQTRMFTSAIFYGTSNAYIDYDISVGTNLIYYWNPPGYNGYHASEIIKDFMTTVAGMDSSLYNAASFATMDSYYNALSPVPDMKAYLYGAKYFELILKVLAHSPEAFMYYSYDSKLYMKIVPQYSSFPTPYVLTNEGSGKNIISIEDDDKYTERLATTLQITYHSSVPLEWMPTREPIIGGQSNYANESQEHLYSWDKTTSGSVTTLRTLELDKPFFNSGVTQYNIVVDNYCDNYFQIYDNPIPHAVLRCHPVVLQAEQGDVVAIYVTSLNYLLKKYLVVGRGYDFDRHEAILTLRDMEFTP